MITQQQNQYTQDLIDGLYENGDPVSVEAAEELQNLKRFRETVQEVMGCFNAAEIEGLSKALQETNDLHLKDLVERRLMYALYAAQQAAADCELDEDQQEAKAERTQTIVVTDEMINAYLMANDLYWKEADKMPQDDPSKWRQGTPRQATKVSLEAALAKSSIGQKPME